MNKQQAIQTANYLERRNLWAYVRITPIPNTEKLRFIDPQFQVECWKTVPTLRNGKPMQLPGKVYTEYPEFMNKEK
jgi:hypothetical protein